MEQEKSKLSSAQFKFVCELLWGHIPVNRQQAEESKLFQMEGPAILEKYPMLDKSFFEYKNK